MENKKILIVDDEKKVRELLELRLSAAGYNVIQAQHGEEGVEKAKKDLPDLILMDVMMPRMDGPEAVRCLGEDSATKDIPVIFLTAIITKDEEEGNDPFGIHLDTKKHRLLAKPFDGPSLLIEIKKMIGE